MLLGAGVLQSAGATELTHPSQREDLFVLQQALGEANMQPSEGRSPAAGAAEVSSERPESLLDTGLRDLLQEGGEGADPTCDSESCEGERGTGGPLPEGRRRFLHTLDVGLIQSYNKTYQAGWTILHRYVADALRQEGQIPAAMRFAIETGKSASYEKTYEEAWEILATTVRTVTRNPEAYQGSPRHTYPALLRLGRLCSYEKSYETGWKVLHHFTRELGTFFQFVPGELNQLTLGWAREASYEKSYKAAWTILSQAVERIEQGVPNTGHVFEVALQASGNLSWEDGWKTLNTFSRGLAGRRDLFPDALTFSFLQATRTASFEKSYQVAYEVQASGARQLRQAVHSPADYFRGALAASGKKSYEDGWDILRDYAQVALDASFLDSYQRDLLHTSLRASYNQTFRAAYEVLREGMRSLSR